MRPLHSIKGAGLRAFLKACVPQYRPPSSATIRNYMGAMYEARMEQLKTILAPLRADGLGTTTRGLTASLITDGWGARNGKSFNATLLTTLNDDFEQELYCLDMREYEKAHHTAAVVKGMLEDTLSDRSFHIPPSSIFRAVHDAGSNISKGTCVDDRMDSRCRFNHPTDSHCLDLPSIPTTQRQLCPTPAS